MKRLLWTSALAVGGFALGWQDQGGRLEPQHVLLVTVWFAAIGFGFGSIFAKRRPSKGLTGGPLKPGFGLSGDFPQA